MRVGTVLGLVLLSTAQLGGPNGPFRSSLRSSLRGARDVGPRSFGQRVTAADHGTSSGRNGLSPPRACLSHRWRPGNPLSPRKGDACGRLHSAALALRERCAPSSAWAKNGHRAASLPLETAGWPSGMFLTSESSARNLPAGTDLERKRETNETTLDHESVILMADTRNTRTVYLRCQNGHGKNRSFLSVPAASAWCG